MKRILVSLLSAGVLALVAPAAPALAFTTPNNCHSATMYGSGGYVNIQMVPVTDFAPFNIVIYNRVARAGVWHISVLVDGTKRWGFDGPYIKGSLHGTINGRWLHKNGRRHIVWINGKVRSFPVNGRVYVSFINAVCMT